MATGCVELAKYRSPSYEGDDGPRPPTPRASATILFVVDDIEASLAGLRAHGGELVGELENYENSYWLCYVRGPAGIIVELCGEDRLMGGTTVLLLTTSGRNSRGRHGNLPERAQPPPAKENLVARDEPVRAP